MATQRITALTFAWMHIGDVLVSRGGLGGECVDLANLWLSEAFNLPHVFRDAVDWRNASIGGFRWVNNTPNNSPLPGSLVVWGQNAEWGIGAAGHIALCLTADRMHIVSFDQNWPTASYARLHLHNYGGVVGWQLPT